MEQEKKVYVNRQIAVLKTGNYLVELVDNLKPAASYFTAHLHARGDKYTDREGKNKRDESSLVQIFMRDYSNKDAESTAVYMNLEPERIRWYHNWVSLGVPEYHDSQEKIFGKPDPEGYSIVTKIKVSRQDSYNGQKKNRPWSILVENGKGIKQEYPNGAIVCKSGSYVPLKKVIANLTDYEFYMLMTRGVKYLDAIENRYMLQPMMTGLFHALFAAVKGLIVKEKNVNAYAAETVLSDDAFETESPSSYNRSTAASDVHVPEEEEPDLPFMPTIPSSSQRKLIDADQSQVRVIRQAASSSTAVIHSPQMTYERACAVQIPFGQYKGKTMGALASEKPDQLRWYVDSYRGNNQEIKQAAIMLLERMKAA